MKVEELVVISVPLEAAEEGMHQHTPCQTTHPTKESLKGLEAGDVDLIVEAEQALSTYCRGTGGGAAERASLVWLWVCLTPRRDSTTGSAGAE